MLTPSQTKIAVVVIDAVKNDEQLKMFFRQPATGKSVLTKLLELYLPKASEYSISEFEQYVKDLGNG